MTPTLLNTIPGKKLFFGLYAFVLILLSSNMFAAEGGLADTKEAVKEKVTAYPNPTHGQAQLVFNSNRGGVYHLRIVDLLGNIVIKEEILANEGSNQKEINLENAASGIYYIFLHTGDEKPINLRLIVE